MWVSEAMQDCACLSIKTYTLSNMWRFTLWRQTKVVDTDLIAGSNFGGCLVLQDNGSYIFFKRNYIMPLPVIAGPWPWWQRRSRFPIGIHFLMSEFKWSSPQTQTEAQRYFSKCQSRQQIDSLLLSCIAAMGSSADSYECQSSKHSRTALISLNNTVL